MHARHFITWWQRPLPRWAEVVFLLLVLALASWFRLYQIGQVPPGPHYDEAAAALDALDVLDGSHMIFSPRSYGRETLFVYVAAPLVALLGPTRLALRLPIALVGILTVLVTYLLVRELFDREDERQAQWTALLAALFLALSFWHLVLNHLSFRANYLPLVEVLCFLFLWRAVRTGRLSDTLISGFFLGLSLYTYAAARFVPIVLVVFFAGLLLTRRGRALILPHWRRWALLALVALLVSAPLLVFFLSHPEDLLLRARGVSIFIPHLHQGDFWGLVARSVLGNLGLFGFKGDGNWLYNIPGRPGLDLVQAVLFWLGVVRCLVRWRRPRYLFLLVWWLVMLLPSILAPDPIPHSLRAVGTLPVACILSARALVALFSPLPLRFHRLRFAVPLALLVALAFYLIWAGYHTWRSYFDTWLPREEVYYAYYGHMADLAEQINRDADSEAVYIFPVNYDRRGETYHEYTLELLHQGPVPFRYIIVDDATVARDLTDICAGKNRIQLVVWTHGEHVDADPRQVLPFLLSKFGQEVEERAFRGYRIMTYELPSTSVDFAEPFDFVVASANFGGKLGLVAQAHSLDIPSGEAAWVALRWHTRQAMDHDYKISLRLVDAQGHLAGQADTWLLSNEHHTTSHWEPGQVVITYHRLPSLPGTLPDRYWLHLVLYDPETLCPIWFVDEAGAPLGQRLVLGDLEIGRPWRRSAVEPKVPLDPVRLAPALELLGYDLDQELLCPGETMHLALYWHASEEIAHDYAAIAQLVGGGGEVAAEWRQEPAYPTSRWQANDLWRDWHDLGVVADMAPGEYQLVVELAGVETDERIQATLGSIEVRGRPCLFQVPDIGHPQVAQVGEGIQLLGYDLPEKQVRAGEVLQLTLYWQAVTESDVSYTVFTHLLDGNSRIWGQKDSLPGGGALPTTSWRVGEVIIDNYEIMVNPDTPLGEYLLEVGMYQAATGQRLPISDEAGTVLGDRILLDTVVVMMH
jgi:4-amino-4-deoxy-L-arabinose transferase-like glycosyltransferase